MYQMVFRFPMELRNKLKIEAEKRGQTLTGMIKVILWEWVEKEEEDGEGKRVLPR